MTGSRLHNAMRGIATAAAQGRAGLRVGLVSAYDPNRYAVKVKFPPDEVETGWIPLQAVQVGNGFGIYAPPNLDDQITVEFQDGAQDAGVAGGALFNDIDVPLAVPAGEVWIVHRSGAFWKLTNDGKATFSDGNGASIALNGDGTLSSAGTWNHAGDFNVNGNQAHTGSITSNGKHVDSTLRVTGVQTGSGTSGPVA
ncbi:MAG: hypothetical protein GAK28_00115 [Luteibacter sp.]|uniref:phage baseplate assembly protein V n=1 Tax=Luteibacter sp. TaxID=1886636 RepID=UPI00137F2262|nr:phage baseplate assembly protein V [Luteibacter sp.]KAF1009477.1 MAG: hypothetical protein GAK28_00115 [Luteibacter sp.]